MTSYVKTLISHIDRVKRYSKFNKEEVNGLALVILILGFMFSYRYFFESTINYGIFMFISCTLIVLLALLVHEVTHKAAGIMNGFQARTVFWLYALLIGFVICLMSKGKIVIPIYGGVIFYFIQKHRIGKFRYGINYWPMGWSGILAPAANLGLAFILRLVTYLPYDLFLVEKAIQINILIAFFNMLPFAKTDGIYMLYHSRLWYAILAGFLMGLAVLLWLNVGFIATVIGAVAISILTWGIYLLGFELKVGK